MGAWDTNLLKFSAVNPARLATLPVLVRLRGPNDIVCDGPSDGRTCQPRGQCVHIKLCQELGLLHLHQDVDSLQHEGVSSSSGADDEDDIEESRLGNVWLYCDGSAIDLGSPEMVAPPIDAVYMARTQNASDRGAMTWVYVDQGKWKCSSRLHTGNNEHRPCSCMTRVMDLLGFTSEELVEMLADIEDGQSHVQQQSVSDPIPKAVSAIPRTLRLQHRELNARRYYIPEDLVVQLASAHHGVDEPSLEQVQGVQTQLEAFHDGELLLQHLQDALCDVTCERHGKPLKVVRHVSRLVDIYAGSMPCEVFHVECDCPAIDVHRCCSVYDGHADDIFNLSNNYLFSQSSLIHMLYDIHHKGCSFNSIREVRLKMEAALPQDMRHPVVSLPTLIRAFFSFLWLLQGLPGFTCNICGEHPVAIIADGTGYKVFDTELQGKASFGQPTHGVVQRQEVSATRGVCGAKSVAHASTGCTW